METTTCDTNVQSASSVMIDMVSIQITPVGVCCPSLGEPALKQESGQSRYLHNMLNIRYAGAAYHSR